MTQTFERTRRPMDEPRLRICSLLLMAGALACAPLLLASRADAQVLSSAPSSPLALAPDDVMAIPAAPAEAGRSMFPQRLRRTTVSLNTKEAPGTIIIDTGNTVLYYVLAQGRAIRYGIGVGRAGFTWSGVQIISNKAEWPDWHPPAQMIARQPYLPRFMAGGLGNPLGARALYLGASEYRIHGTNDPTTIGKFVSSGCIRLTNEDVIDLFNRVGVGTKVVVMPKNAIHLVSRPIAADDVASFASQPRDEVTTLPSGRQALNLSTTSIY